MRIHLTLLISLFLMSSAIGLAQDAHVKTEYFEDRKMTVVSIDPMFLLYTSDRRVAVEMKFDYSKQKLVKPPKQINFLLKSLAKEVKFPQGERSKIVLLVDGESVEFGKMVYLATGYVFEKERLVGVTLKPQIKGGKVVNDDGKPIAGPVEEMFAAAIGPKAFLKLANAKIIEIQLGDESFKFTENQMNSIRHFARQTVPQ